MRKTLSTIVLALGLVFTVVPASSATTPDPDAPSTNGQCVGATNAVCDYLLGWARLTTSLEATITSQAATIQTQRATIRHQRAVIRHLRAKLARTR